MPDYKHSPNRFPLPPIITVAAIIVCFLLDRFLPVGWQPEQVTLLMRGSGVMIIVLAIALDVWAFATFRKHQANMMPHKAASRVLMSGPFAHSRNPIYLANVLLVAGLGFAFGSRWFLLGAIGVYFLLLHFAIKREEAHMEANFPTTWPNYKKLVRRWI